MYTMGWTYMYEQWTKKKPTPNMRNVHIANAQRIHRVFISTLSYAQNVEHVQNKSKTLGLAFFCVPQRTANVYHVRPTWHERITTYTSVHTDFPIRRAYVSSIRNSIPGSHFCVLSQRMPKVRGNLCVRCRSFVTCWNGRCIRQRFVGVRSETLGSQNYFEHAKNFERMTTY